MTPLQQFLESEDFYDYCQRYRHSLDDGSDVGTASRFNQLKAAILNASQASEFVSQCISR